MATRCVQRERMRSTCSGPANGALQWTTQWMRRSAAIKRLNVLFSASPAWVLKNVIWPLSCASMSIASILPRNRRASTLTCTRKLEREATHRALSSDECRAPGVQHGRDAEPRAEALGIVGLQPTGLTRGGDGECRLGRRLHQ